MLRTRSNASRTCALTSVSSSGSTWDIRLRNLCRCATRQKVIAPVGSSTYGNAFRKDSFHSRIRLRLSVFSGFAFGIWFGSKSFHIPNITWDNTSSWLTGCPCLRWVSGRCMARLFALRRASLRLSRLRLRRGAAGSVSSQLFELGSCTVFHDCKALSIAFRSITSVFPKIVWAAAVSLLCQSYSARAALRLFPLHSR